MQRDDVITFRATEPIPAGALVLTLMLTRGSRVRVGMKRGAVGGLRATHHKAGHDFPAA